VILLPVLPSTVASLWEFGRTELSRIINTGHTEQLDLTRAMRAGLTHVVWLASPLMTLAFIASLVAHVAESRGLPVARGHRASNWERISLAISRESAAAGMVRWFSLAALVAATGYGCRNHLEALATTLGRTTVGRELAGIAALRLAWIAVGVWLLFGGLEYLVSRRAWLRRHAMSDTERRREQREIEGDPWVAVLRAERHREVLRDSALASLHEARLVIHARFEISVILGYTATQDAAPRVLDVCAGAMARRVISESVGAGVPSAEDERLTRALARCHPGDFIPESAYGAVAELLVAVKARLVETDSLDTELAARR